MAREQNRDDLVQFLKDKPPHGDDFFVSLP